VSLHLPTPNRLRRGKLGKDRDRFLSRGKLANETGFLEVDNERLPGSSNRAPEGAHSG
jgi:hypothetical protein